MGFKISASDVKEIIEYLSEQCPGSNVEISISPTESVLSLKASNKRSELVSIEVYPEDVSTFPKLSKSMRLKDDK